MSKKSLPQRVKSAVDMVSTGNHPYFVGIEKFLGLIIGKRVPVRPAPQAATSGDIIYLPPQELDEEGKLIYMGKALHEVSHIIIGSDFSHFMNIQVTHKHGSLMARLINIADDIRVESGLQNRYPRVVDTTRPYWLWKEEKVLPDIDQPDILQSDIVTLVMNVGVLFIARCRFRQLGLTMTFQPNPLVSRVYDEYFANLEEEALAQVDYKDSVSLAEKLYQRIKDMIRDDVQPPQQSNNNKEDNKDDNSNQSSDKSAGDTGDSSDGDREDSDTGESSGEDSDTEDASEDREEGSKSQDSEDSDDTGESEEDGDDGDEQGAGQEDDSEEESNTSSQGDGEDDSDDSSNEDREESEDGSEESGDKSEEDVQKGIANILNSLNNNADNIKTLDNIVSNNLTQNSQHQADYVAHPEVVDNIQDGYGGSNAEAQNIKALGLSLLGKSGRGMIRHFISQTKPRIVRRQDSGRFDTSTFLKDRYRQDIYNTKTKGGIERAALAIALDNSESMVHGRRAEIASALVSGLIYHADKGDLPVMAAGYTTGKHHTVAPCNQYRTYPVRIDVIKRFEDRYTAKVQRRCCPLPVNSRAATPDLDCLRWMTPLLMQRREEKKVLFVICDGNPTAQGPYLTDLLRSSYKRYIEACKLAGIKVFGFGICSDISEYFGDDWAMVDTNSLADTFVERLRIILNSK